MYFRNEYWFLSNMYPCKIKTEYGTFECAEAYFQAMKCPERANEFCGIDGFTAKRLGRTVKLIPNWNYKRIQIMSEVLLEKFNQNPELKEKLLTTGNEYLQEDNNWNDTFWGRCNGKGKNNLGKLLMMLRDEIYK